MATQAGAIDVQLLGDRLLRLARLDTSVFDEVRSDESATLPALLVAAVSTLLAGLGGWLWWWVEDYGDKGKVFVQSLILGSVFSVALWVVWLLLAYVMLTQIFHANADWQQMLRTMGFAALPLALGVLMIIAPISLGVGIASLVLTFGLTTIAIQSATDADAGKVLAANIVGFAVWAIVLTLLVRDTQYLAPGVFLFDSLREAVDSLLSMSRLLP